MKLVIVAQDIAMITFGLVVGGECREEKTVETPPEGYLDALGQTLRGWSVALSDLETVFVVTGPGSFTASRVSTTIANALGFAVGIPVVGIENPKHVPFGDLDLSAPESTYTVPTYNHLPEITASKDTRGDNTSD